MTKEEKQNIFTIEFNDAYELLVSLADSLPESCNCDGEYFEGRIRGTTCTAHEAERILNELGL